jgi:hypothetical protein
MTVSSSCLRLLGLTFLLQSLVCFTFRPAGYHGKPSQELLDSLHVTRYQSSKAALSFADYQAGSCSRLQENVEQLLLQGSGSSSGRGRLGKLLFA